MRRAGCRIRKFSAASILIILCFVIDCKAEFLCSRLNSYSTPQSNCLYNVKTVFYKGTQQATFCDLRLISSFYDAGDCVRELDERGCLNRLLSGFHSNHRIIINSGILALREKKSEKGRLLPVTQNCDEGIVLIAYAIAIGESSEKQNECCIKLGCEVFGVEEGRTGRRQGGGMCLCQVDMSHSKIVSLSTIGSEKVDAQIEDSNISFLLIHGSKSRRIQIGMEDVKGILAHMGDT